MSTRKVLISGASVAGPALAYWLNRYGYEVTVVERAPELRGGGQAVDFKGVTHRTVLDRMDLWEAINDLQTGRTDLHIVDDQDRVKAVIPGEFSGGDVEILRGDLATLLYQRTVDSCRYLFDDHLTALVESGSGVEATFANGDPETFDLVVGTDGVHSGVRRLAFGPEDDYVRHLGFYYAVVGGSPTQHGANSGPEHGRAVGTMYNTPGRMITDGGPKAPQLYVFASPKLDYDRRDVEEQKRLVTKAFAGVGWRVPQLLARLPEQTDFYLDSISRVHVERYTKGRFALVGDAAYGNTLGGFGTGLALVGAHVLAGELAVAEGDHRVAFERYTTVMHRYAKIARSGNAGPFLAPPSKLRIGLRNLTFANRFLLGMMMKMTDQFANDIELPDYPR
ncbi:FAD-dependent monooxygenase [Microlunatus speluncae]|uniref:FAD-dependent monooxygenase n=1 Tax=Microlunatus speluncae TaxID=2594267 RepID=UPI00126632E9|nr:FAD-dependent monooxygenase [Microlunatus speluncae]